MFCWIGREVGLEMFGGVDLGVGTKYWCCFPMLARFVSIWLASVALLVLVLCMGVGKWKVTAAVQ
jgi:hypothetical protein